MEALFIIPLNLDSWNHFLHLQNGKYYTLNPKAYVYFPVSGYAKGARLGVQLLGKATIPTFCQVAIVPN